MNFLPNDLQNIVLKKSFMGYNIMQIEDLLDKIVEDLAEHIKENSRLKDKLDDSLEKINYYKGIESSLQNSLIVAQQTSDEIIANAKKNAENIIKEAELKAKQIIDEANRDVLDTQKEFERMKREVETYRIKVESIIRAQLRSMQNLDEQSKTVNLNAV
ncbi:MAG: DivIVA domain-containing protein [Clostridiaceae bacterium]|nr:DivIVA domain-containing protein [Clostridiaceae bacterium]